MVSGSVCGCRLCVFWVWTAGVYMRMWDEYVRGCLLDMCICAITAFIRVFQCVLTGKAYFTNICVSMCNI